MFFICKSGVFLCNKTKKLNTMNTKLKKSALGTYYVVSTSFKVGDKVAIHNRISGEISYIGTIVSYVKDINSKTPHFAKIKQDGIDGHTENFLGTALVIE